MKVRDAIPILEEHGFRLKRTRGSTDGSKALSTANADWSRWPARNAPTWRDLHSRQLRASPPCRGACSATGDSGGRGYVGFQEKRPCAVVTGALQLMDPSRDGQPRPELPRCPPCQESAPLCLRQLGDTLQVHLDADSERRLDFLIRSTVDGNVQISADPVPAIAVTVGITPKCRHGLYLREGECAHPNHYNLSSLVPRRRQALGPSDHCTSQHGIGTWLMASDCMSGLGTRASRARN